MRLKNRNLKISQNILILIRIFYKIISELTLCYSNKLKKAKKVKRNFPDFFSDFRGVFNSLKKEWNGLKRSEEAEKRKLWISNCYFIRFSSAFALQTKTAMKNENWKLDSINHFRKTNAAAGAFCARISRKQIPKR